MGLFIGVDEQGQRFSQIGQGMGFVLADLIDYLIEHCYGLSIVILGTQHAERNESTKSPVGGLSFADNGGRHVISSNSLDCTPHVWAIEQTISSNPRTASGIFQTQPRESGAFNDGA
jgi:hypothetical protein